MTAKDIESILMPETELEKRIVSVGEFREGVLYGKPRNGHSEGQVIHHIRDVLNNVERYSSDEDRERLRLIALIHDTFKYKVDRTKPRIGGNNHAMLARKFAARYIEDKVILDLIELHDEAYYAWQKGAKRDNWNGAEERANRLIERLRENLALYLVFYRCDNETDGKERNNYIWFENL
ncbi:MAG: HD domain-containing protein, partial [Nanoarchaeota archaeon]